VPDLGVRRFEAKLQFYDTSYIRLVLPIGT
jgi:hypothetical protein